MKCSVQVLGAEQQTASKRCCKKGHHWLAAPPRVAAWTSFILTHREAVQSANFAVQQVAVAHNDRLLVFSPVKGQA